MPVVVRIGVSGLGEALAGEDVLDLADPVHGDPLAAHPVEDRRPGGRHGEIAAAGKADELAGSAGERASDDASHAILALQQSACEPGPLVERRESDDVGVGGDLEHRVPARVHDGLARPKMLLPQALDDLGSRRRHVAEHLAPDRPLERLDQLLRKSVRVDRERTIQDDAGHLPMPGGGVLSRRPLREPSVCGPGPRTRLDPLDPGQQAQAEVRQIRRLQPADGSGGVREGVGSLVPVVRRVGRVPDAEGIADDDHHAGDPRGRHGRSPSCLQRMHRIAQGRASSRSGEIGPPHRSHVP